MLVIVGTSSAEHYLRSQVGVRSKSHCLLGQLIRLLRYSTRRTVNYLSESESEKI